MIRRLNILKKGLILIAVPLLFQLGFIGLVSRMRSQNANAVEWTIHTRDVIALAESCRVRLLSAHGSVQGYIIARDPAFGDELARLERSARAILPELPKLVSDNPPQVEAAGRVVALAGRFLGFMTESAGLVRSGRMDQATAAARRRAAQVTLDALNRDFESFIAEERRLDAIRHDRLHRSGRVLDRLILVGTVVSVLITAALAVLFARGISGRIAILTDNSYRLAEGKDLTPMIGGGDEIARLDQVFHVMARTLADASRREREHAELLERRAEELALVNGQLNEQARENEMFVYSVSHDLRSPLVNLQGFSKELGLIGKDLLRLVDGEGVAPEVRRQARDLVESEMAESVGFIQVAVTRLSAIIDALLRLSRAGRVEYRIQPVEVDPIVARVVAALRGTIDERGAKVAVAGGLPPAMGDPTAVEQVFANLIGNAINYLDPARPGRIEVVAVDPADVDAPAGASVYAVRDNGLGIAESYKGKIFTAFQRLHGDVAKGEGVGLALVRRVVERHGGRIWFESEAGRGTTFYVALPAIPEESPTAEPASAEKRREVAWQPSR